MRSVLTSRYRALLGVVSAGAVIALPLAVPTASAVAGDRSGETVAPPAFVETLPVGGSGGAYVNFDVGQYTEADHFTVTSTNLTHALPPDALVPLQIAGKPGFLETLSVGGSGGAYVNFDVGQYTEADHFTVTSTNLTHQFPPAAIVPMRIGGKPAFLEELPVGGGSGRVNFDLGVYTSANHFTVTSTNLKAAFAPDAIVPMQIGGKPAFLETLAVGGSAGAYVNFDIGQYTSANHFTVSSTNLTHEFAPISLLPMQPPAG